MQGRRDWGEARAAAALGAGNACARGNQSSAVVPPPKRLDRRSAPCDCAAMPCTIDRPRPVPLPMPLVVKNGSVARASVAPSMPVPLSATVRHT